MTRKTPQILIIGAQHGDERLGPRINRFLKNDKTGRYRTVDYLCGNPRAYRRNVRFTETDLNRSYNTVPAATYEQKRAQKILRLIATGNYDYVLDIHTSRAAVGRLLLMTHLEGAVKRVVEASCIERIAIMPPDVADCSLIGQAPHAISVEYDRRLARSKRTLQDIVELLDNLLSGVSQSREREVFFVDGKIPLDCPISYESKNFELCEQGFYPIIFARNSSYAQYKGFAARKREVRII